MCIHHAAVGKEVRSETCRLQLLEASFGFLERSLFGMHVDQFHVVPQIGALWVVLLLGEALEAVTNSQVPGFRRLNGSSYLQDTYRFFVMMKRARHCVARRIDRSRVTSMSLALCLTSKACFTTLP